MNTYSYYTLVVGVAIGALVVLSIGFLVYDYRGSEKVEDPSPASSENAPSSKSVLEPHVSSQQLNCEEPSQGMREDSRRISYGIQSKDVLQTTKDLVAITDDIEGAQFVVNRSSFDSAVPRDASSYASLTGAIPQEKVGEIERIARYIEAGRVAGTIFVESKSDYTEPAQNIYQSCLSQLTAIQSLELKEAVLLKRLEQDTLSSEELDITVQNLSDVRMQYSSMFSPQSFNILDVKRRLDSIFLDIYINNMTG